MSGQTDTVVPTEPENKENTTEKKVFSKDDELFFPKQRKSSKNSIGNGERTSSEILDSCIEFLASESGMDIYQLVAFRARTGNRPCQNGAIWGYYMEVLKLIIILITQIVSIIVLFELIFDFNGEFREGKELCANEGESTSKMMATIFTFFLSIYIYTLFESTGNMGFYFEIKYAKQNIKFISSNWLHLGRIVNLSILLSALILSFFLILFTSNALDMLLNAVALVFIVEIDNMILAPSDYEKTRQWFEDVKTHSEIYSNPDDYINAIFEPQPMGKLQLYFWNGLLGIVVGLFGIALVCSPAYPFIMAWCY